MLPPTPLPSDPAEATAQLRSALINLIQGPTSGDDGAIPREAALGAFRRHLGRIQAHVRDQFEQGLLLGLKAARLQSNLMDGLMAELFAYAGATEAGGGEALRLSMAATGGYGRGVLAPFSDIDLLFITADVAAPADLRVIEFTLYFLWDLGLKVGHATRSVADCLVQARGDATVRTSTRGRWRETGRCSMKSRCRSRRPAARRGRRGT